MERKSSEPLNNQFQIPTSNTITKEYLYTLLERVDRHIMALKISSHESHIMKEMKTALKVLINNLKKKELTVQYLQHQVQTFRSVLKKYGELESDKS